MTLPSSGALKLSDIRGEFGGSAPDALSEYYGKAAGIPLSGALKFSDFYGKSAAYAGPTFVGVGPRATVSAGNTSGTVTYPSGLVDGDMIIMVIARGNTGGTTATFSDSGFSQFHSVINGLAIGTTYYWKRWVTADGTTTGISALASTNTKTIQAFAFRNCKNQAPQGPATDENGANQTANTLPIPSMTSVVANELLCFFCMAAATTCTDYLMGAQGSGGVWSRAGGELTGQVMVMFTCPMAAIGTVSGATHDPQSIISPYQMASMSFRLQPP